TVAFKVGSTKPLAAARLVVPGGIVSLARGRSTTEWTGSMAITTSGQYYVELSDTEGFRSPASERYQILALEDKVPRVLVLEPGKDLSIKANELTTIPVKIDVADDFGIRQVTLKCKLVQKIEYNYMTSDESISVAAPAATGGRTQLTMDYTWDLSNRMLQPGDSIAYYVEAGDYCPSKKAKGADQTPDPGHVGVSKTYTIKVPYPTELFSRVAEEEDSQIASVEDLADRQRALEDKVEKVLKDVKTGREVGYKEKKELEQIVARQAQIKEKAMDVAQRMKDTLATLQKNELVDEGTLKKLGEIHQLFQEVADSKMKEHMEKLREMMQSMRLDSEQLAKMMQQFDKSRYSKELDRILKSLRRVKQRQELDHMVRKADELIKKQEEMRTRTASKIQDKSSTQDLSKDQEELARDVDKLVKKLPKLAKEMESEYPQTAQALDQLHRETQQSPPEENLKQAASDLKQNQGSKAYKEQSTALQKMEKMRGQLKSAQAEMKKKQVEIDLQALIRMLNNGLAISSEQELVQKEAALGTSAPDLRRVCLKLAGRQYAVLRGSYQFEKEFDSTFDDEVMFKTVFLSQISQLTEDMYESKKLYEETRLHSAKQLSERSLTRLNVILAKLMEVMQQLQDQQCAQGMESFFDQMERMAQQQRKLNEKSQRLKPQESMTPFMMEMMQQMAGEQEVIRKSLEEMAAKYDKAKNLLGNLDELGKEMKDVEEALKKFDRSAQTRDKQEKILTKMLDYSKSIHKQGQSEKRPAEVARPFSSRSVPALSPDLTEVRQKLFENMSRETYPPQHKKVVEDYFSSFGQ
ncbi:MAG: hypothetical protein HY815_33040, partial [Candidatus Riflebacteria bacterium]|nr:hypothetical protein [Candidatus Riflebacteria bacterium]